MNTLMSYFYWWPRDDEANATVYVSVPGLYEDEIELMWRLEDPTPFGSDEWNLNAIAMWDEQHGALTDLPFTVMHLHSPRLRALLTQLGLEDRIQYLSLKICSQQSGVKVAQYYLPHFLQVLQCKNEKQTQGIVPVLRADKIERFRLFKMAEHYAVVVRQDVKDTLEEAGITGCKFEEAEVV